MLGKEDMQKKPIVVFDTCTVRAVIHGCPTALEELGQIGALRTKACFRIADPAVAELLLALREDRIAWTDWKKRVHCIGEILDQEMPIMPGGKELSEMMNLSGHKHQSTIGDTNYWKAAWEFLLNAKSESDLLYGKDFTDDEGNRCNISIQLIADAKALFALERAKWACYFEMQKIQMERLGFSKEKDIINLIKRYLDADTKSNPPISERLNAMVHALGHFLFLYMKEKTPYNPRTEKRRGDLFDFSLLQVLALPGRICTKDSKFKTHVKESGSTQADMIMLPHELIEWLQQL